MADEYMTIDTQLSKGVLEGCVLRLLEGRYRYSGEIVSLMRGCGFTYFSEGTLYPMLLRLEKAGCFTVIKKSTSNSPPKKYYKLSEGGLKKLRAFEEDWGNICAAMQNIFAVDGGSGEEEV